jgi:hypothetical protein
MQTDRQGLASGSKKRNRCRHGCRLAADDLSLHTIAQAEQRQGSNAAMADEPDPESQYQVIRPWDRGVDVETR